MDITSWNLMLGVLSRIAHEYYSPDQLRNESMELYGLDYEEALEMAYDNIQADAKATIKDLAYEKES
jgi:hypothetical protein